MVAYCSTQCRERDWEEEHREQCGMLAGSVVADAVYEVSVRDREKAALVAASRARAALKEKIEYVEVLKAKVKEMKATVGLVNRHLDTAEEENVKKDSELKQVKSDIEIFQKKRAGDKSVIARLQKKAKKDEVVVVTEEQQTAITFSTSDTVTMARRDEEAAYKHLEVVRGRILEVGADGRLLAAGEFRYKFGFPNFLALILF